MTWSPHSMTKNLSSLKRSALKRRWSGHFAGFFRCSAHTPHTPRGVRFSERPRVRWSARALAKCASEGFRTGPTCQSDRSGPPGTAANCD